MTGLVRKATLFAVCGLLAASAAMASVPSASNSDKPSCIMVVGSSGGVVDTYGDFTVVVRDLANLPINNSLVVVDFSACHGLDICQTQPGFTVTGPTTYTVRGFTDVTGTIVMRVAGHSNNGPDGDITAAGVGCCHIYADGVDLLPAGISVSTVDHDGNGVGPADLTCWLGDNFGIHHGGTPQNPPSSDYDCSGDVGPADLSIWLDVNFGVAHSSIPGSDQNCPAVDTEYLVP